MAKPSPALITPTPQQGEPAECSAAIHHGPGHQSTTHCAVIGEHTSHETTYGEFSQVAEWEGPEVFSGFFDDPPQHRR